MRTKRQTNCTKGVPTPLGATVSEEGINFALYSKHATAVTLCLMTNPDGPPTQEIHFDPIQNRSGFVWHLFVQGIHPPLYYAYKVDGPTEGKELLIFNKEYLLLDPYAREVSTTHKWASRKAYRPFGAVLPPDSFNWENVESPRHKLEDLIIYEMHVRSFTQHDSSRVVNKGTFLGLIEKIPHLLDLGVNAVELMPLQEFNENEIKTINPVNHRRLYQYWGYSTLNFFSPTSRYATQDGISVATREFKTMVRELHRHGIEVILDVVYNHTSEGSEKGPLFSYKGIDTPVYYIINNKKFENYSGCGNTFNCNHPVTRELILDSMRYWVQEMHVDGFRFDLASILMRGRHGQPLDPSPLVEMMSEDPILANTKLIAEPWDAAGLYHVGYFYTQEPRWSEWNGKYRDSIRRYIKGTPGTKGEFTTRICGSQDLYHNRTPTTSINFVTCHDGFTLYDLVSYNGKHNEQNGEENRDGTNDNESWNCGEEGETQNKQVNDLRQKQIRNFQLALMISTGIPMLHMGDEYAHTKKGNNNTWTHDDELNYFLWNKLEENQGFYRFVKNLIRLRKNNPVLRKKNFLGDQDIAFHGFEPNKPDWAPEQMFVAFTLFDKENHNDIYVAFNPKNGTQIIEFPDPPEGKEWHLLVNTSNPSPKDFFEENQAPPLQQLLFKMQPYSSLLLKAY